MILFSESVLPVDEEHDVYCLLGILLGIRSLIPYLTGPERDHGMKGSFGLIHKGSNEKHITINIEQIIQVNE